MLLIGIYSSRSCVAAAEYRYDLNAMFKKQFGFMTVNVQGLSRASRSLD